MWKPKSLFNNVSPVKSDSTALFFERMEPKILLSADALSGFVASDPFSDNDMNTGLDINQSVDLLTSSFNSEAVNEPLNIDALSDLIGGDLANSENIDSIDALGSLLGEIDNTTVSRQEIIFVDAATPDYQQLLDGLTNNPDIQYQIFILQSDQNGIEQISSALSKNQGIDAIHLVSHGNGEGLQLGNTWLSNTSLNSYNEQLQQWNDALDQDADILIYGCDLASQQEGQSLINNLAALTQADVTASDDLTGTSQLGGDWQLEYTIGEIESVVAFNASTQNAWMNVLGAINVTTFNDVVDADADLTSLASLLSTPGADGQISLREAVIAANTDIGADTITLGAGTYQLSISLSGSEDNGSEGDLDITDNLVINGATAATTFVDASGVFERAFDVHAAATGASISNLSIINSGHGTLWGGGLRVTGANVALTDVVFSGNQSHNGGGIYNNAGTVTLNRVDFTNNVLTENNGGAIYNDLGTLNITDANFISNVAKNNGGAIYSNSGPINLTRVDFTDNDANGSGAALGNGGAIFNRLGNINGSDVVFSSNHADSSGGAIYNTGSITLDKVLFFDNDTKKFIGGAMHNEGGIVRLTNATFSENVAQFSGGAISNFNGGILDIYSSTFTANDTVAASGFKGILQDAGSTLNIKNTLLNNADSNIVGGTINSLGYNIDANGTANDANRIQQFTKTGDRVGTLAIPLNVNLDILADNGGFGKTHALLAGSVAINAGTNAGPGVPVTDQRGVNRSANIDIGAYETASYLDQFNTIAFNGDDGSLSWANDWQEINEADGANSGQVSVKTKLGEQGLELKQTNYGVWREADLSGADTAILSFNWAMFKTDVGDKATIEVSTDGGLSWTVIDTFSGPLDHSSMQNVSYDISAYIDVDTRIKFETTSGFNGNDRFFFDNVSIELTGNSVNTATTATNLSSTSSYTEGDVNVAINNIVVSDADSNEIVTANLTLNNITTGGLSNNDGASYDAATGIWSITGNITDVNTALFNLIFIPATNNDVNTSITVSIDDGDEDGSGALTGTINLNVTSINDVPVLGNNNLVVSEGQTVTVTNAMLSATDIETADASLAFIISNVSGGQFELSSAPGTAITSFTQSQLTSTVVVFVDNGDEAAPSFDVRVSDSSGSSVTVAGGVNFTAVNDSPLAMNLNSTNNYIEGNSSVPLTDIVISDPDNSEIITATLTLLNVDTGLLSTTGGASYDAVTGVWTITDTVANVNQALASINFIPASETVTDSEISIVIDDGDEDSSGPLLGALTVKFHSIDSVLHEDDTNTVIKESTSETTLPDEEIEADTVIGEVDEQPSIVEEEKERVQVSGGNIKPISSHVVDIESDFLQNNKININGEKNNDKNNVEQKGDANVTRLREQAIAFNDPLTLINQDHSFVIKLNDMREELLMDNENTQKIVGGSLTVSAGFSVGYVVWLARSGVIMSSVLSSLPAWRFIDPLPVLASLQQKDKDDDDDESLESIVGEKYKNEK